MCPIPRDSKPCLRGKAVVILNGRSDSKRLWARYGDLDAAQNDSLPDQNLGTERKTEDENSVLALPPKRRICCVCPSEPWGVGSCRTLHGQVESSRKPPTVRNP